MRYLTFLVALCLTCVLAWVLSTPQTVSNKQLPPLGAFFNPFSGFWQNAEPARGATFEDVQLDQLQGPVRLVYDELLVPHIFAQNLSDAMRVQGYVTAQHRLFQMDITARKAAGRLSEVFGERTFDVDRMARRRGMLFAAENDIIGWQKSPESAAMLDAYAAGVNAWIQQLSPADYPIEYKLLNFKPEPWSPLKSALVLEAMAETLCSREDDLEASNALLYFGRETFDYLFPEWNPKQQPIIPDSGQWKDWQVLQPPPAPEANSLGFRPLGMLNGTLEAPEPDPYLVGSNNWALSGNKTRSGNAMLANDPHLNLTLPSVWFQVQIHTPESNSYGVSLPGAMGIVIGFNENIAWGLTNVGHDVTDYYTVKWTDAARTKYQLDNEVRTVNLRREEIQIKGKPTFVDTVRYTVYGPVPFDHQPDNPLRDCAMRWMAHDIPKTSILDAFLQLNRSKSYDDYKRAIGGIDAPAQNVVFASRTGDIAIQVQGRLPVRGKEQGRFIQDGSKWANAWHSDIPNEQVPSMKNPERGFVFSANQHSTPPTYPYYFLADFEDNRSRRIFNRLNFMQSATLDSMKSVQLDNYSQKAADALPAMLHLLDLNALNQEEKQLVGVLSQWNFRFDADQLAPTLFESWCDSCYMLTWDEMSALNKPILYPDGWRWIDLLQNDTTSIFFDIKSTPARETAREIVLESFKQMKGYFDKHPAKKTAWGTSRVFEIRHLALLAPFSRLDLKPGGHKTAPNAISSRNGPSWRMLIEFDKEITALGIYPGGQSGNPGSKWYDNMVDKWVNGEYYPLLFLKSADQPSERIIARQVFTPQN